MCKGPDPPTQALKDKDGKLLLSPSEVISRWREFFAELLQPRPEEQVANGEDEVS